MEKGNANGRTVSTTETFDQIKGTKRKKETLGLLQTTQGSEKWDRNSGGTIGGHMAQRN